MNIRNHLSLSTKLTDKSGIPRSLTRSKMPNKADWSIALTKITV